MPAHSKERSVEIQMDLAEKFNTMITLLFDHKFASKQNRNAADKFFSSYIFTVHNARKMLECNLKLKSAESRASLQEMLDARLLHYPCNRTLSLVKSDSHELQLTAKGFAFLQKWFFINGKGLHPQMKQSIMRALESKYNTMDILDLERTLLNDKIRTTTGLSIVLWVRMLGRSPQAFDLDNFFGLSPTASLASEQKSDAVYKLSVDPDEARDMFGGASPNRSLPDLSQNDKTFVNDDSSQSSSSFSIQEPIFDSDRDFEYSLNDDPFSKRKSDSKFDVSPYFHRSMMHPSSLNLMQYWDARGIRLFRNLTFERQTQSKFVNTTRYTVDYVLSGQAILQWINDCTSVQTLNETMSLARLLLRNGFFRAIEDPVADSVGVSKPFNRLNGNQATWKHGEFNAAAMYRLTPRGIRLSEWEDEYQIENKLCTTEELQQEYENAQKALNKDSANNNEAENWRWEIDCPPNIDQTFASMVDLLLIQREPALKVLFRLELERCNRVETLMFIDDAQRLLLLVGAVKDAQSTVTRRELLETKIHDLLARLEKTYMAAGSPLELNLSQRDRQLILKGVKSKSLDDIVKFLLYGRDLSTELLRDAITNFKASEITCNIPALRKYVVSKYTEVDSKNI